MLFEKRQGTLINSGISAEMCPTTHLHLRRPLARTTKAERRFRVFIQAAVCALRSVKRDKRQPSRVYIGRSVEKDFPIVAFRFD